MKKICIITGNSPRHYYLGNKLIQSGKVSCWIIEKFHQDRLRTPKSFPEKFVKITAHHFNEMARIEDEVFSEEGKFYDYIATLSVEKNELNSAKTYDFIKEFNPEIVLSYGCSKLDQHLTSKLQSTFWNIHGGLSPHYRGVITHFWPSYFLEPQMTGMTLHETTNAIDSGAIIFQTAAPMVEGDTLHRLAARNIEIFSEKLKTFLITNDLTKLPAGRQQVAHGKLFLESDWRPEHLRLIYEIYEDKIVDAVINGQIKGRQPKLISVL